eukprot:gene947-261_t
MPSGFSTNTSTTLAWDNDDFREETRTGSGTAHVTGGIILHRKTENEEQTNVERKDLPRRKSSLEGTTTRMDPYILGRRLTVDLRNYLSSLCIDEESHKELERNKRLLDLSFVLCRSFNDTNIPNLTGFNTELQYTVKPSSTKIGYLPIIDASPTELATVNAILTRSTEIADKFIIRMGNFHMAMSYCGAISKFFKDTGLKDILAESDLVAIGSLPGVLTGKHYNRSARCHKVMYEALVNLLFQSYLDTLPIDLQDETGDFISRMAECYPDDHFDDYLHTQQLESLSKGLEEFAQQRSTKYGTFSLWLMYIGMGNYARYGSFTGKRCRALNKHIQDNWTCQQQQIYSFSAAPCDQTIEQTFNRDSKTKGGITGATFNRKAVQRWILPQSERGTITSECYEFAGISKKQRKRKDLDCLQTKRHNKEVAATIETISSMINPFAEDLVNIVSERIMAETTDIFTTIPKTKLKTFSSASKTLAAKTSKGKLIDMRNDAKFVARLLAVGKSREIDFENLMSYSLHVYPSAFATSNGQLQKTPKVKLLHELENRVPDASINELPMENVLLLDGMEMLQTMKDLPDTFGALGEKLLQRVISEASLTQAELILSTTHILMHWEQLDTLKDQIGRIELFMTHGKHCHHIFKNERDETDIAEIEELYTDEEEADTRLLLHAKHASLTNNKIVIRTPDTDVFILMVGDISSIANLFLDTGPGNYRRLLNIYAMEEALGAALSTALIGFHAFTECDTTSSFYGKGKIKPLTIMEESRDFVEFFATMGSAFTYSSEFLLQCERFFCKLYNFDDASSINEAHLNSFRLENYDEQTMPCNLDSLKKHLSRSVYQTAIWRKALSGIVNAPDISNYEWNVESGQFKMHFLCRCKSCTNNPQNAQNSDNESDIESSDDSSDSEDNN